MACGVDSGCINRELSIECPEDNCPCGPFCQNRKLIFTLMIDLRFVNMLLFKCSILMRKVSVCAQSSR